MNYFQLYNLPPSLYLDPALVKERYYALSRKYHPDFFSQGTPEEQAEALEKSSLVNSAFKVFQHPDETIQYLLQLKGLLPDEEKYQLSPDFLMEMMDLNEQAQDIGEKADIDRLTLTIENYKKMMYAPLETIITHYQEDITTEKELLQVKDYYYQKKYLDRILAGLR